jgi:gluconate 2-dehydrogenase gamma chain
MFANSVSRRDVLKSLGMGAAVASALHTIPAQAAEFIHNQIAAEKAKATTGAYTPKFFPPRQYKTLQSLCETILPADADCGGALEAGAPEFIDLLTSETPEYQLKLGNAYLDCTSQQQKEILDLIAHRKNAVLDPGLSQGVVFFSFLRDLTADGFFTSQIGIQYLGYVGNTYLRDFPGCPPVPGV